MGELTEDEQEIVEVVRDFVNREVKPVVRDLEHANTYPDKLIEQMKNSASTALPSPSPGGRPPSALPATRSSPRNYHAAG